MENPHEFLLYWLSGSLVTKIIAVTLIVLLTILALWLTFELISLSYWLTQEIFKLSMLFTSLMIYFHIFIFILLPIEFLLQGRRFGEILDIFIENTKRSIHFFYPKIEEKVEKSQNHLKNEKMKDSNIKKEQIQKKSEIDTFIEERDANTEIISYNTSPKRSTKMSTKTPVGKNNINVQKSKFFCTKCGKEFSPAMLHILKVKNRTFCKKCGKLYKLDAKQGKPIPVSHN